MLPLTASSAINGWSVDTQNDSKTSASTMAFIDLLKSVKLPTLAKFFNFILFDPPLAKINAVTRMFC